jgi:indolepyruvate ferredoxin oxidoreductase
VARLYTDPRFMQRLREQFAGDFTMTFNLAPPMLPGRDATGRPKKRAFGAWMMSAFKLLAPMKVLRGTVFDPFGYFAERRMERRLIEEYRALVEGVVERLDASNLAAGVEIVGAAADVGGYGPVKHASVERYEERMKGLMEAFEARPVAGSAIPVRKVL